MQVSTKTISRNLFELNFPRITVSKFNDKQRENRLNWCIERNGWPISKWKTVIWSDESCFEIFKIDREFGKGLGPLVKAGGNMKTMNHHDYIQILESHLLPFINNNYNGQDYLFQDDNAPAHTAKNVKKWIETKKIKILENWPSQSPDLNPIKHLWSELERRIRKRPNPEKNLKEFERALHEEWNQIPNNILISLIESMPHRIEVCIKNNGWPTNY
ncbi:IS630 family transposase [Rhizophagus irregularis DAOM 181602=DAOM 197198]|nr:IS630 family transposase [Rhizophagus irregularis DAOM 181602=DAOM 197198]